jgi:hypothetical protein
MKWRNKVETCGGCWKECPPKHHMGCHLTKLLIKAPPLFQNVVRKILFAHHHKLEVEDDWSELVEGGTLAWS